MSKAKQWALGVELKVYYKLAYIASSKEQNVREQKVSQKVCLRLLESNKSWREQKKVGVLH